MITSNGGGDTSLLSVVEGQTLVTDVIASGTGVTYAIAGGVDAGRFTIDPATGRLSFVSAPDFETPGDSDGDNVYEVIVSANDGSLTDTQTLSVSIADRSVAPRLITPDGFAGGIGGTTSVFLTSGFQDIRIIDAPGTITLSGPPGGDDIIRFDGDASGYTITRVGSRVEIADGDTIVSIPVSPTGINVAFADGPRTLAIVAGQVQIGTQVASNTAASITALAETDPLPNLADPAVRGRLIVAEGSPVIVDGNVDVFGTTFDAESFTIAGGDVAIRGGFTGGLDTIGFDGPASSYTAARSGSTVFIEGGDTRVSIPISPSGTQLSFDGEERLLRLDAAAGTIIVGEQAVATESERLIPGAPTADIDLADLNGVSGFVINGIDVFDNSGYSVSGAGDFNGDGFDDLIIGAPFAGSNNSRLGESYVVFGSGDGFSASFSLSGLSGDNGFVMGGIDVNDFSGRSVSSAGDVNGDGFDDVIIGTDLADPNGSSSGESYVVYGSNGGFGANFNLSSLDGNNGFVINGVAAGDQSGISVSSAGDINGDGFDDLIIGAFNADPNGDNRAGESYVVFGSGSGLGASLDLSSLNGSNGFVLVGAEAEDRAGSSVSGAGDVNGDGFDDLIVGAYGADPGGRYFAGASYVVFGAAAGFNARLDLAALNGSNGFKIIGANAIDRIGVSVSSAGDVNGDGFDDVIIGASFAGPNGKPNAGASYVVYGRAGAIGANVDLGSLDGTNGFAINGANEYDGSGRSVSSAGDFNGDGFDDLLIGAFLANPNGNALAGQSYVVFGKASGFGPSLEATALNGINGFVLNGVDAGDRSGRQVSAAGDVNGDGFDDLIIGAFFAGSNNSRIGESYVIFGGATGTEDRAPVTRTGTAAVDNFTGNAGDDTFNGIGAGDVVRGGAGDDSIAITANTFADINGGRGTDTLALAGSGLSLNLTTTPRPRLDSIEMIDLTGSGNNSLTVSERAIYQLTEQRSGGEATLIVKGNSGDSVIAIGFTANGTQVVGGITYNRFEQGNANLLVESGVSVTTSAQGAFAGGGLAIQAFVFAEKPSFAGGSSAIEHESIYAPPPDTMLAALALDSFNPGGI